MELIPLIKQYFADICLDTMKDFVADKSSEAQLHRKINDFVQQKFDTEYIDLTHNIDFTGLLEYIKNNLVVDIKSYLREISGKNKENKKNTIVAKALAFSHGTKTDKDIVQKLIQDLISIVTDFYLSNVPTGDITAQRAIVQDSEIRIIEKQDKDTKDILHAITNSNNAIVINKYITVSPPHVDEDKFAFREDDINTIFLKILNNKKLVLLNGIGGVGKTAIARVLYHKLKNDFKYVAWVTYQDNLSESLLSSFNLYPDEKDNRLSMIINFLQNEANDTLVFIDNVTNDTSIDTMLKNLAGTDVTVILTSRQSAITGYLPHEIGFLSEDQCVDIFYLYYKYDKEKDNEATVHNLVQLVSNHTLSVELLAKGANKPGTNLKDYYKNLTDNGFGFPDLLVATEHTDKSQTIAEHLKKLFDISKLSHEHIRILNNFSHMPSILIPAEGFKWINCDVNDLVNLASAGWLDESQDGYLMHPVIKEAINLNPYDARHFDDFIGYIATGNYIYRREEDTIVKTKLLITESILSDYEKTLAINGKSLGAEHPNAVVIYSNIALVYHTQGDISKALGFYDKALAISEKLLGTESPNVAIIYSNMARLYINRRRDYSKALEFYNKALAISEKALGTEHLSTLITYKNIAMVYFGLKDFKKGFEFYHKAVAMYKKSPLEKKSDTETT